MNLIEKTKRIVLQNVIKNSGEFFLSNISNGQGNELRCDVVNLSTQEKFSGICTVLEELNADNYNINICVRFGSPLDFLSGTHKVALLDIFNVSLDTLEIKKLRASLNLKQYGTEAAELVNISSRTLKKYELGERKVHAVLWELFKIKAAVTYKYLDKLKEAFANDYITIHALNICSIKGSVNVTRMSDIWVSVYSEEGIVPSLLAKTDSLIYTHIFKIVEIDLDDEMVLIEEIESDGSETEEYTTWLPFDLLRIVQKPELGSIPELNSVFPRKYPQR